MPDAPAAPGLIRSGRHQMVPKVWGREEWIANRRFCGKVLRLKEGARCSLHFHREKDETFYVLSGKVLLEVGPQGQAESGYGLLTPVTLTPGDSIDIPPFTMHRFFGAKDSAIVEFSTHHEDTDTVRLEPSQGRA